jgi:hypothetical protein
MIKKIAAYISFVLASLVDLSIFFTSSSYVQLAIAILLYLPLAYFAFKLFPRKTHSRRPNSSEQTMQESVPSDSPPVAQPKNEIVNSNNIENESVEITDINKRTFLKLIGATGLSFFVSSFFTKRFETLLGKTNDSGLTGIQDSAGNVINPAKHHPTDSYKISEVDYGINTFYGFIDRGESWFIMKEDINAGTFRYVKGNTNFRDNWSNRQNLKYDYFNQVFPKSIV